MFTVKGCHLAAKDLNLINPRDSTEAVALPFILFVLVAKMLSGAIPEVLSSGKVVRVFQYLSQYNYKGS